ncbi:MAG: TIGR00730 family Rossman fold protein, partial [Acidimicrobiales bacterium]|nr:TIGR00730 family Rossman fold protein [Acidimicrobiales bacterium]
MTTPGRDAAPRPHMRNLSVFCGSSPGTNPAIADATVALGHAMVAADIGLVYG